MIKRCCYIIKRIKVTFQKQANIKKQMFVCIGERSPDSELCCWKEQVAHFNSNNLSPDLLWKSWNERRLFLLCWQEAWWWCGATRPAYVRYRTSVEGCIVCTPQSLYSTIPPPMISILCWKQTNKHVLMRCTLTHSSDKEQTVWRIIMYLTIKLKKNVPSVRNILFSKLASQ